MGQARSIAGAMTNGVHEGLRAFRRGVATLPLAVLIPLTLVMSVLAAPLGLVLPVLVWLARHSWNYERELLEIYGPDSAELADLTHDSDT